MPKSLLRKWQMTGKDDLSGRTRVFIVGQFATGKSVCGAIVASELSLPFVDTDQLVSNIVGESVYDIFAKYGACYFRRISDTVIENVCIDKRFNNSIVAVGATSNLSSLSRGFLKKYGKITIKLNASPRTIWQRIKKSAKYGNAHAAHPLLLLPDPLKYIALLHEFREPYYDAVADVTVSTDAKSIDDVVSEIVRIVARTSTRGDSIS